MDRREFLIKLGLTTISTTVALAGAEVTLRLISSYEGEVNPFRHNPIIAAQTSEEVFFPDSYLGHRLVPDYAYVFSSRYDSIRTRKDSAKVQELPYSLITKDRIQSIDEVTTGLDPAKPIILNIGDSSTSGWDSDAVTTAKEMRKIGRVNPISLRGPFFQYLTYSDVLGESFQTINAGVPGYASLQGARYLERLFEELSVRGIKPSYITIYFGNNDSVCNGNVEDKTVLPRNPFSSKLLAFLRTNTQGFTIVSRTSLDDYRCNLERMVNFARASDVKPILIRPLIPKVWYPGLRASTKFDELEGALEGVRNTRQGRLLLEAIDLYKEGLEELKKDEIKAESLLVEAQNRDYMVPRIKPAYVEILKDVADKTNTSLIDVQTQIPIDDRGYFIDYCHPIEPANRIIAQAVVNEIE